MITSDMLFRNRSKQMPPRRPQQQQQQQKEGSLWSKHMTFLFFVNLDLFLDSNCEIERNKEDIKKSKWEEKKFPFFFFFASDLALKKTFGMFGCDFFYLSLT